MTKVNIFSGFLGAGKTTLIKKLIGEVFAGENVVLIENEFGEIGVDGGFLKDSGIKINEMNSGCICCSLVGDFKKSLAEVVEKYEPDRILIEPSGVGKLSDVISAVKNAGIKALELKGFATVVDAKKCKMYTKNFGEFFNDQIENSGCIIFSHTGGIDSNKIDEAVAIVRRLNEDAMIITTDWNELSGEQILEAIEEESAVKRELEQLENDVEKSEISGIGGHSEGHHHSGHEHEHHHSEHGHGPDEHGGHHHEGHGHSTHASDEHEHHHTEHGHGSCEHDHHHGEPCCGHEHHHHADDVFNSIGFETSRKFEPERIKEILNEISNNDTYGTVLRAKGILETPSGAWTYFDYVPGEIDIRKGNPAPSGLVCVIGTEISEAGIRELFLK